MLALGALWGLTYVALRYSMVGLMMGDDGQFHLFDAWALTKGKAGALFLVALCLVGIAIAFEMVIVTIAGIIGVSVLSGVAGGVSAIPDLFRQPPTTLLASLTPFLVLAGAAGIPLYGAFLAIFGAPWARAYLDLHADPAAVFSVSHRQHHLAHMRAGFEIRMRRRRLGQGEHQAWQGSLQTRGESGGPSRTCCLIGKGCSSSR